MRTALATALATLILSHGYGPAYSQTQSAGISALESIYMVDARSGWAVTALSGTGTLLRTIDGGTRWRVVTPRSSSGQEVAVFQISVLTPLIAWAVSSGTSPATNTQIFHTIDGGRTWSYVTIPGRSGYSIQFITTHDGWLLSEEGPALGSEQVDVYRSTDAGETWTRVASARLGDESSGLPFGGSKGAVTFLNATTGWITGADPGPHWVYLYVTHDGGRTWRQQGLRLPPQVTSPWYNLTKPPMFFTAQDGVLPVFYSVADPITYHSIASFGVFYITHDGGTTWAYTTPLSSWGPLSFADINHGFMTDGQLLYTTRDGGQHWNAIRPGPPFSEVMRLDFVSSNVGWALREKSPFLLKSLDGGRTWAPVAYTIVRR
jgi:photosystem II stability/assembly factor-like uncharacterized protein